MAQCSVSASYVDLQSPIDNGQFTTYIQYPVLRGLPVDGSSVGQGYDLMAARWLLGGRYAGHGYAVGRNIPRLNGNTPITFEDGSERSFFAPSGAQGLIKGPPGQSYQVSLPDSATFIELLTPLSGTQWHQAPGLWGVQR